MEGRIKTYNEQRGFGFLHSDEDGKDYFFHISEVLSEDEPRRAMKCKFSPGHNNKGLCARNIELFPSVQTANVIMLGNTRIFIDDIKQYGISYTEEEIETEKLKSMVDSAHLVSMVHETLGDVYVLGASLVHAIRHRGEDLTQTIRRHYLYITLYGGSNFKFFEDEVFFSIYEKRDLLDKYMGAI